MREKLVILCPAVGLAILAFLIALYFVDPFPPRRFTKYANPFNGFPSGSRHAFKRRDTFPRNRSAAGVIGLAIGFGPLILVKDIIAGIFFLIEDAFRDGDYMETGGQKGTAEHISLRSLRLRNPRGPVHTIPFGGMGTVTNMSCDDFITKLDFRVRYDTDA